MTQYYEDLDVSGPRQLGTVTVTREEVVQFAERYDPLPFHLDEAAAVAAGHEGLIASGYHTLALVNGVVVREHRRDVAAVAGFGIDHLEWPHPVRPGDTLTVSHEVVAKRRSESREDAGVVETAVTAANDRGDVVVTYETAGLIRRRS